MTITRDFIEACYGRPVRRRPIWIMRQAGRYLPEYRQVRERVSFEELCHSPKLIAEVTAQPIDVFGFDAAILFSDILLPLEPLGIRVSYDNGGPRLSPMILRPEDIGHLTGYDPAEAMTYVLSGIREIKKQMGDVVPLIGFAGSPFTLVCYLVEGGGSWDFLQTKKFLYNHPKAAARLLDLLADLTGRYLKEQINAGADAVQLFDSWGGILPPDVYRDFSLPYIKTVFEICRTEGIPRLLYLNNSAPYLPFLAELDCEVISVDWRTDIEQAIAVLDGKAVQGNLDPHLLLGPAELVHRETLKILEATAGKDNFIFNLGHGIHPETPLENVRLVVDTVHAFMRDNDAHQ